ncbi:hypothetical protein [Lentzea sp. CC55]|uniref:hypothetical protein n=1 Tax=Lentzea sp. CC55 TaxID=2884909 RepID=UPI001F22443B|nr:hypothetical protein [Lentzea sp. CC55]MCG8927616.1 hypothetical protein [Lentzea sp. CC55]
MTKPTFDGVGGSRHRIKSWIIHTAGAVRAELGKSVPGHHPGAGAAGHLWKSSGMAVTVGGIGLLYPQLLRASIATFLPHVAWGSPELAPLGGGRCGHRARTSYRVWTQVWPP